MRNTARLVFAALAAALLLAAGVSTATARNFSLSSQTFRATFAELRFTAEGGISITCRVTMEGSYHSRTIAKVREALVGSVTAVSVAHPCNGGEGFAFNGVERTPNTLPWHLQYDSFEGTLPSSISGITQILSRFRFLIQVPFVCAASYGVETDRMFTKISMVGGVAQEVSPIAGRNTTTRSVTLSGICPNSGTMTGGGAITALNSTARITVTLI
ncbi:MAG: hypothetical protein ACTHOE_11410 [Conexibacter sp.]